MWTRPEEAKKPNKELKTSGADLNDPIGKAIAWVQKWVKAHFIEKVRVAYTSRGSADRYQLVALNASGVLDQTVYAGALYIPGIPGGATDAKIELGAGRTADGNAYIDLVGDTTYSDYGLRLLRSPGANGVSNLRHRGTGDIRYYADEAAPHKFYSSGDVKVEVTAKGTIVQGSDPAVGVQGAVRMKPQGSNAVANAATLTLNTAFVGFIFIMNTIDPSVAIIGCTGTATQEISDPSGTYSVTAGTGGMTNVYVSGGNIILQNNRGGSRTYHFAFIGAGNATFD